MIGGDSPRILIADDCPAVRDVIETVCLSMGYDVDCVHEGRAAWALISSIGDDYSLVFLDVLMPGWSGDDVLGMLEILPRVRRFVVVITGDLPEDMRLYIAMHPSVLRVLHKPLDKKLIEEVIELSKTL